MVFDMFILEDYSQACSLLQLACDGKNFKPPKIPLTLDENTTIVLLGYRRMVIVWNRKGGSVPKITQSLADLLFVMTANNIQFKSVRTKQSNRSDK